MPDRMSEYMSNRMPWWGSREVKYFFLVSINGAAPIAEMGWLIMENPSARLPGGIRHDSLYGTNLTTVTNGFCKKNRPKPVNSPTGMRILHDFLPKHGNKMEYDSTSMRFHVVLPTDMEPSNSSTWTKLHDIPKGIFDYSYHPVQKKKKDWLFVWLSMSHVQDSRVNKYCYPHPLFPARKWSRFPVDCP